MSDFRPGAPLYWSEIEVVSRRVNLPPGQVRELLLHVKALPAGVSFEIDGLVVWRLDVEFAPDGWAGKSVCATGRLLRRKRHLERSCRIELEAVARTTQCCELSVRPASRHIERWTRRKRRRYFELAHCCADDIVRRIYEAARDRTPRQSSVEETSSAGYVGGRT